MSEPKICKPNKNGEKECLFLNNIRCGEISKLKKKQCIYTVAILIFGVLLGTLSKFLDDTPANELPLILEFLDVRNFLGRFAFWVLMGICISVDSDSSVRAAINVFVFFCGVVASYYLYSNFVAGFFPKKYAMIWVGFTIISPFLAIVCRYAKGKSKIAFVVSAIVLAALFNMTFVYGLTYFESRSLLETITFIAGVVALRRKTLFDTVIMIIFGVLFAIVINFFIPFNFG